MAHVLGTRLAGQGLLQPDALVVIELGPGDPEEAPEGLHAFRVKRYGDTRVLFLKRPEVTRGARADFEEARADSLRAKKE
jgi:hypothetical protein